MNLKPIINYFRRNKLSSLVNLLGLSTGFSICLLLGLYIKFETSFDNFYEDADRIYRLVVTSSPSDGEPWIGRSLPPPLKPAIESRIPEIDNVARLYLSSEEVFKYEDDVFEEENAYYADQDLAEILELEFTIKNKEKPLEAASCIVMSESAAQRYFSDKNPLGKIISLPWGSVEVSAVYRDLPKNMHIRPELIISFDSPWWIKLYNEENWDLFFLRYYLKLKPGSNPNVIGQKITGILNEVKKETEIHTKQEAALQLISDIHLGGRIPGEQNTGNIKIINALKGIALFIFIIVLINFINLASAQIFERSSQVSIRKILGISKLGIIRNFTLEAGILQVTALIVAFLFMIPAVPAANSILDTNLSFALFNFREWSLAAIILLSSIGISVLYPISIMLSFNPIVCLKGKSMPTAHSTLIRKGLIGFQFFVSFALIFGTLVFYRQSQYLIHKDIGIDTRNMLVIRTNHADWNSFPSRKELFKNSILTHPQVISATNSNAIPGFPSYIDWITTTEKGAEKTAYFSIFDTDYDFIKAMELKLIVGRELSKAYGTDAEAAIITRSGIKILGFLNAEDVLGKVVIRDFTSQKYHIVGVVDDFQLNNLQKINYPPFISINENQNRFILVRYNPQNEKQILTLAEENWNTAFGNLPFRYFFLDDNYKAIYSSEVFQTKIISAFSLLAIILAAMGLFGMTYFMVVKREKEFSIRKVNGAVIRDIFLLVAKGFILLIIISSVFALPIAWWLSSIWLNNYGTRISINWWFYFIPLCILGLVTLLTISYHTLKTAWVNPARLLRNE